MDEIIEKLDKAEIEIKLAAKNLEEAISQIKNQVGEASATRNGKKYVEELRAIGMFANSLAIDMECLERNMEDVQD